MAAYKWILINVKEMKLYFDVPKHFRLYVHFTFMSPWQRKEKIQREKLNSNTPSDSLDFVYHFVTSISIYFNKFFFGIHSEKPKFHLIRFS